MHGKANYMVPERHERPVNDYFCSCARVSIPEQLQVIMSWPRHTYLDDQGKHIEVSSARRKNWREVRLQVHFRKPQPPCQAPNLGSSYCPPSIAYEHRVHRQFDPRHLDRWCRPLSWDWALRYRNILDRRNARISSIDRVISRCLVVSNIYMYPRPEEYQTHLYWEERDESEQDDALRDITVCRPPDLWICDSFRADSLVPLRTIEGNYAS